MSDRLISTCVVQLSYQIKFFCDTSNHQWTTDIQNFTIVLVEFVIFQTASSSIFYHMFVLTSWRDLKRLKQTWLKSMSISELLEFSLSLYLFLTDWVINWLSLNQVILKLHRLLEFITNQSDFNFFAVLFTEFLFLQLINRSLESSSALLLDYQKIHLERNFNSFLFDAVR